MATMVENSHPIGHGVAVFAGFMALFANISETSLHKAAAWVAIVAGLVSIIAHLVGMFRKR